MTFWTIEPDRFQTPQRLSGSNQFTLRARKIVGWLSPDVPFMFYATVQVVLLHRHRGPRPLMDRLSPVSQRDHPTTLHALAALREFRCGQDMIGFRE